MKNQALFSSKDKSKKIKCRLLQFLFGALRVKIFQLDPLFYVYRCPDVQAGWCLCCLYPWIHSTESL